MQECVRFCLPPERYENYDSTSLSTLLHFHLLQMQQHTYINTHTHTHTLYSSSLFDLIRVAVVCCVIKAVYCKVWSFNFRSLPRASLFSQLAHTGAYLLTHFDLHMASHGRNTKRIPLFALFYSRCGQMSFFFFFFLNSWSAFLVWPVILKAPVALSSVCLVLALG